MDVLDLVVLAALAALWAQVRWGTPLVFLVRRVPLAPRGALGAAGPGFIFLKADNPRRGAVLRHELEHLRQMARWSPPLFALLYWGEILVRCVFGGLRFHEAYAGSRFEQQANRALYGQDPLRRHRVIDLSGTSSGKRRRTADQKPLKGS